MRAVERADIDTGTRVLLTVVLDELQHVRVALHDLRL